MSTTTHSIHKFDSDEWDSMVVGMHVTNLDGYDFGDCYPIIDECGYVTGHISVYDLGERYDLVDVLRGGKIVRSEDAPIAVMVR